MDFDSIYAHIDEDNKNDDALGKCKIMYTDVRQYLECPSKSPTLGLCKDLLGLNGKWNKIPRLYPNEYQQPTTSLRAHGTAQNFFHSSTRTRKKRQS